MDKVTALGNCVELVRLDRNEWRAFDLNSVASDPRRILGFIERIARNRYEVLWLLEPPRWAYVDSLSAAISAILDANRFTGTIEASRVTRASQLRDLDATKELAHG